MGGWGSVASDKWSWFQGAGRKFSQKQGCKSKQKIKSKANIKKEIKTKNEIYI